MKHSNAAQVTSATLVSCDPAQMKWMPWAMRGTHFKLLHADSDTGRFSLIIKIDKGAEVPMHRHVGAVEGIILEGGFHYNDQPNVRFVAGSYLLENDGAIHQPVSPEGATMFAIFHGAVEGLDEDGKVTGRIDWKWHVDAWTAEHKLLLATEN
jgi:2,4'-dihydroxyacetophenone dioxygenase